MAGYYCRSDFVGLTAELVRCMGIWQGTCYETLWRLRSHTHGLAHICEHALTGTTPNKLAEVWPDMLPPMA